MSAYQRFIRDKYQFQNEPNACSLIHTWSNNNNRRGGRISHNAHLSFSQAQKKNEPRSHSKYIYMFVVPCKYFIDQKIFD